MLSNYLKPAVLIARILKGESLSEGISSKLLSVIETFSRSEADEEVMDSRSVIASKLKLLQLAESSQFFSVVQTFSFVRSHLVAHSALAPQYQY